MSPDLLRLHEGALFIGDAHYSSKHPYLLSFLKAIASGKIVTPQLILMGDIFDQLFGGVSHTLKHNTEAISLINAIASRIEVIYLEGNHDFQLASLFKDIRIYPLDQQPVPAVYGEKKLLLSHGDQGLGWGYGLYTKIIRKGLVLWLLNIIDELTSNSITRWIDKRHALKDDCRSFEGFESYTKRRLASLDLTSVDHYIDGHYHQNRSFEIDGCDYINLAAFSCNQSHFQLQSLNSQKLLKEVTFSKES